MGRPKKQPGTHQVSKHTPGPWTVRESKSGFPSEVVTVENHAYGPLANARLIAAAPRMAEMLLSIWQHVSHGGPTRGEVEALLREAGVLESRKGNQ